MKLYLDTANIKEIEEVASFGILDGVTTNPSLIAKEGKDFIKTVKEIVKIFKNNDIEHFTVSAEITDLSSIENMIVEGRKLAKIDKSIIVKVPLTREGLKVVSVLSKEDIRCNVTLCFSAEQALLAAKAGAWCVSPFLGRLDDIGENSRELIEDIKKIYENYKFETKILAASIRGTEHVKNSAITGCDIVTMPYKVFVELYKHELTNKGLEKFKSDWEEFKKKH